MKKSLLKSLKNRLRKDSLLRLQLCVGSMKLKIKLLKPFSNAVGKSELEMDLDGNTLRDLLKLLVDKYPKLKKELYTKADELTEYLCVFVNDKPISALNGVNTKLKNDDEILFFIPISGG